MQEPVQANNVQPRCEKHSYPNTKVFDTPWCCYIKDLLGVCTVFIKGLVSSPKEWNQAIKIEKSTTGKTERVYIYALTIFSKNHTFACCDVAITDIWVLGETTHCASLNIVVGYRSTCETQIVKANCYNSQGPYWRIQAQKQLAKNQLTQIQF